MAKAYLTDNGWRKTCSACRGEFELSNFNKNKVAADGLSVRCKQCSRAAVVRVEEARKAAGLNVLSDHVIESRREKKKIAYAANPEKHKARSKAYVARCGNRPYSEVLKYKAKNPDHHREYARMYYHNNKETLGPRHREQVMRRYAAKISAIPSWIDKESVMDIYKQAHALTEQTGVKHQVDHIVPILSKIVCGLHVQQNLQILSKIENIKKGNRMWPGHPDPKRDISIKRIEQAQNGIYLPKNRRDAIDAVDF